MTVKALEQRIRQLIAVEHNARDIFVSLSRSAEDPSQKKLFQEIANDEIRHAKLENMILDILSS